MTTHMGAGNCELEELFQTEVSSNNLEYFLYDNNVVATGSTLFSKKPKSVKRKQWSNESMEAALQAVKDGLGVNKAAELHGIPKTTLKDRVSGRVAQGSKSGPKSYLTDQEEKQLADYLIEVAEAGYGKTRKQVKAMVEGIAKEKGILASDKKISDGWW